MKFFVYQIISVVTAIKYGCNDISKNSKSQCYVQAMQQSKKPINLSQAVKCCLSNTVGNDRVFTVPIMQFKELGPAYQKQHHRKFPNGPHLTPQAYKHEPALCYPKNEKHLTNFYNFLKEFNQRKLASIDKRWNCFLTNDYQSSDGERNFCKTVLNKYVKLGERSLRKDVCEQDHDGRIFPYSKRHHRDKRRNREMLLNDITEMDTEKGYLERMLFLDKEKEITRDFNEKWSNDIQVFKSKSLWNDYESDILKVLFDERFDRMGYAGHGISIVRKEPTCGCTSRPYSAT